MAFSVKLETSKGIAKFTLSGELDAATANEFKDVVQKAADEHPKRLVLMVKDLTFMASAGLRVLIFAKQKMDAGVDIYVIAPQTVIRETLEKTGFIRSVIVRDEYDAAEIENL